MKLKEFTDGISDEDRKQRVTKNLNEMIRLTKELNQHNIKKLNAGNRGTDQRITPRVG